MRTACAATFRVDRKSTRLNSSHSLHDGSSDLLADQKRQIAENDRALQDANTQMTGLNADEDRVRRNIQSLNNVAGQQQQVQTYARQLDAQEQQLAALRDKQAELQKKRTSLQGELDKMVEALTF